MDYLEHHIVDHCNLKCAGCSHFSCLAEPWFEDIEDFQRAFFTLSVKTLGDVGCIRLMGGEPLLHPQYDEFLRRARLMFENTNIQIVTNGLLLQKEHDKLVDICNKYNIQICVSNYGLTLDLNELLKDFKWKRVDGKTQLYNISLNLDRIFDKEQAFNNCDLHINHWYYFQHGRFYPCCIAANIQHFEKHFGLQMSDWNLDDISISIYEHSIQEIEEFLNKPIPMCEYCDTVTRQCTYKPFYITGGDIREWICQ